MERTRRDRFRNEVIWKELGQKETLVKLRTRRLTWFLITNELLISVAKPHLKLTRLNVCATTQLLIVTT